MSVRWRAAVDKLIVNKRSSYKSSSLMNELGKISKCYFETGLSVSARFGGSSMAVRFFQSKFVILCVELREETRKVRDERGEYR